MLQIVVDTNVFYGLVCGSSSARAANWLQNRFIRRLLADDDVRLLITEQIYAEYRDVISEVRGCDQRAVRLFFLFMERLDDDGKLKWVNPRFKFYGAADSMETRGAIDDALNAIENTNLSEISPEKKRELRELAAKLPKDNKFVDCVFHDWQAGNELLEGRRFLITNDGDFDHIRRSWTDPKIFRSDERAAWRPVALNENQFYLLTWANLNFSVFTWKEFLDLTP